MAKIRRSKRYEIRPWKEVNGCPSGPMCLYDTKLGVPLAFGYEGRLLKLWRELSS